MSNIVYFTDNEGNGVQLSTTALDVFQDSTKLVERAFLCLAGNNGILCGVTETAPNSGVWTEGVLIFNNELFWFPGGTYKPYITAVEETTKCTFCSGDRFDIFTIRTAAFSDDAGDTFIAVDEDLTELYRPTYTFFTLDARVVTINGLITTIQGDIITIQEDITTLDTRTTTLEETVELQQNQIDYLVSIIQNLEARVTYIEDNCCSDAIDPPASNFTFTNGTVDEICVFQAGSFQGKLSIDNFNPTATGLDIASVQGVVAVRLEVDGNYQFINVAPTDALPYSTVSNINMSSAITTALKAGIAGTIYIDVRFTDTNTIEHIATFDMVLQSWTGGLPDPNCEATVTVNGPAIDEI
jgi:hypothetical protein